MTRACDGVRSERCRGGLAALKIVAGVRALQPPRHLPDIDLELPDKNCEIRPENARDVRQLRGDVRQVGEGRVRGAV